MLVLDRRESQGFWLNEEVFVKVVRIGERRVKIGIQAPPDMVIVRDELLDRAEHRAG
jgi:carbon storage regulator CsrA